MTPTLWLQCECTPDPIHVATRADMARLDKIRETVKAQLAGCEARFVVTEDDRQPVQTAH